MLFTISVRPSARNLKLVLPVSTSELILEMDSIDSAMPPGSIQGSKILKEESTMLWWGEVDLGA